MASHPDSPRLLVVGAGYLGGKVAEMAEAGGWRPTCVVRGEESKQKLVSRHKVIWVADAVAEEFWNKLEGKWAGMVWSIAPSRKRAGDNFQIMHEKGAVRAAEWAGRNGVSMVYVSSTSVYAESEGGWVDESSPLAQDDRSQAMVKAERATLEAGGCALRCAGLYGPGRELRPDDEGPERWVNLIQVEDAARAVGLALAKKKQVFNVSENQPVARGVAGGVRDSTKERMRRSKKVSNAKLRAEGWCPQQFGSD